jgi:hypothetical protein
VPSFGEIGKELQRSGQGRQGGAPDFDGVRRKYVRKLSELTKRPAITYYANFIAGARPDTSIILGDMAGMMEVLQNLSGPSLDIVLHSPGGSAEATESIVHYLRTKFDDIRVFVPLAAMSAATMWALAADRIVMGKHSQLGPIDPQLMFPNANGAVMPVPARAIIEQFERAKTELSGNIQLLAAWTPLLQHYNPGLLQVCQTTEDLAKRLVCEWLEAYMLRNDADKAAKSQSIATFFADPTIHQSHNLGIHRERAIKEGVVVDALEDDQRLQDAILSVHHATLHTFSAGAVKIIENSLGLGYYTVQQQMLVQFQQPSQPAPAPAPPQQIPPGGPLPGLPGGPPVRR